MAVTKVSVAKFDDLTDRKTKEEFYNSIIQRYAKSRLRKTGHVALSKLNRDDMTTWKTEIAGLSGVLYGGLQ